MCGRSVGVSVCAYRKNPTKCPVFIRMAGVCVSEPCTVHSFRIFPQIPNAISHTFYCKYSHTSIGHCKLHRPHTYDGGRFFPATNVQMDYLCERKWLHLGAIKAKKENILKAISAMTYHSNINHQCGRMCSIMRCNDGTKNDRINDAKWMKRDTITSCQRDEMCMHLFLYK